MSRRDRRNDLAAGHGGQTAREKRTARHQQWTRGAMTFPTGTHLAEVEADPETGAVGTGRPAPAFRVRRAMQGTTP
jgi:CO/xanthine dehydrogenase Mo-binding subunit